MIKIKNQRNKRNVKRVSKGRAKRLERKLIKSDDQVAIDELSKAIDNSNIDIKNVVKNMNDSENMAQVVRNNFQEIIEQNNVRDTLKYLDDTDVAAILEEKEETLRKKQKMAYAIQAIGDNDKKLKAVMNNLRGLSDIELSEILTKLKPEKTQERREYIEKEKIKIVGKKVIEHITRDGSVWHIKELTSSLENESKKLLLDLCLRSIYSYENDKNSKINSNIKTKLFFDMFLASDLNSSDKSYILKKCMKDEILTEAEVKQILEEIEKAKAKHQEGRTH